jgi:hypothetical protein
MDFQLIFFLFLAFLFLIAGIFSLNILAQLMGITILLFLIYDYYFNYEEKKKYEKMPSRGGFDFFGLVSIFGHLDLTLGILLLIKGFFGIIPLAVLSLFAILVLLKALPFVIGGDIASILDTIFAITIFFGFIAILPSYVFFGISIYFIQKGILSYFSC